MRYADWWLWKNLADGVDLAAGKIGLSDESEIEMAQEILGVVKRAFETGYPESLLFANLDRNVGSEIIACLDSPEYDIDESCFR